MEAINLWGLLKEQKKLNVGYKDFIVCTTELSEGSRETEMWVFSMPSYMER